MLNYRVCFVSMIEVILCIVLGDSKVRQSTIVRNFQIHRARRATRQGSKLRTRRKNSSRASFRYSLFLFPTVSVPSAFAAAFPFFLSRGGKLQFRRFNFSESPRDHDRESRERNLRLSVCQVNVNASPPVFLIVTHVHFFPEDKRNTENTIPWNAKDELR